MIVTNPVIDTQISIQKCRENMKIQKQNRSAYETDLFNIGIVDFLKLFQKKKHYEVAASFFLRSLGLGGMVRKILSHKKVDTPNAFWL